MWTYRCYDDGEEPNLWQRWYESNREFNGTHDAVFRALESMTAWDEPYTKYLDKKNRIVEVRLTGSPKHRILGCYSGRRYEFIILGTCIHKQRVYTPKDIQKTVAKRKKEIEQDSERTKPCVRPRRP